VIGEYRVRCFLSANWLLRDAVLIKVSKLIESQELIEETGFDKAAPALCGMIARAVDDRNPKVFLTSLIVLDDVLHEMEKANMAPKNAIPMLENIILSLIGKLSDRALPKAVGGAFTMLVNFALSSSVGHTYMGGQALKSLSEKDKRAGKTVCARLELITKLMKEFGEEAVGGEKVLEWISGTANGYANKDETVRHASKELTKVVYQFLGSGVLKFMGVLNARQLREYRLEFDKITVQEGVKPCDKVEEGDSGEFKAKSGLPEDWKDMPSASEVLAAGMQVRRASK